MLFVDILEHVVDIWKSLELKIIIDEFVDIELKLPVFGDLMMAPKVGNVFDELFLELLGFGEKKDLKL